MLWIVAAASLIVGTVIWRGAKDYAADVRTVRADVVIDMKELHCLYFPGEDLDKHVEASSQP